MHNKKTTKEFNLKLLNKIMDMRYNKQPDLKNIKKKIFSEQINFINLINQNLRAKDNDSLDEMDKKRWDRQIFHPLLNQKKIRDAKIIVFGCGGIGSNVLLGLAYSGVNNFKIIDFDRIEISNLNRQTLYTPKDIGSNKVNKAKERLLEINPKIMVQSYDIKIDYPLDLNILKIKERNYPIHITEINEIIKWGDYIVNALDYQGAPYLINDLCIKNQKPYYWGGVNHFLGEIYHFRSNKKNACLRCIFSSDFFNKNQFLRNRTQNDFFKGINLGTTVISTGIFISELIIHDICGICDNLDGSYLIYNAYNLEIYKIPLRINEKCECQNFLE